MAGHGGWNVASSLNCRVFNRAVATGLCKSFTWNGARLARDGAPICWHALKFL